MEGKLKVLVASVNPVKIDSARAGLERSFPDCEINVSSASIPSGVSDQPMSDLATLTGATNRASRALEHAPHMDLAVGIEAGIEVIDQQMFAFAWVVVSDATQIGRARSGAFPLPPEVQSLVEAGRELGAANDIVFNQQNSKQKGGAVGLLTGGVMDRRELYEQAVILALIPFKCESLFHGVR